ncbi:pilus assembly protein PilP [uncultured Aquimonas sp.]|jgi:type IV pilus assembly protein PilP|uniref:pilus assembly protein PilP n=1 Tax=uncultured Aquimonas sp. TaxID=385483 RepID=UPI00086EC7BC|nr:MAG: fimbrial protein [Xanthomonadaceae bacterium SCN 69-123]
MSKMPTIPRFVALFAATFLLAGCDPGMRDLENYVADVKQRPAPPLEPLPVMKQFETFVYAAQDLRDPFSMPQRRDEQSRSDGPRPDPNRRKEILEAFPLDGLDMVGLIGAGENQVALVMDPQRVVHRVRVGQYLGQSDGRIVAIREDGLELVELIPDGSGGWLERPARLALDNE